MNTLDVDLSNNPLNAQNVFLIYVEDRMKVKKKLRNIRSQVTNMQNILQVKDKPIVAVGGIGGSGTRLIASLLESLDYYIGNDLNISKDNLFFSFLFRYKKY